jgi:cell division protein ZapD
MRLEQLFQQLDHFTKGISIYDKRAAVSVLLDILLIFSRYDLKSEVIKELDRHANTLNQIANSQGIDRSKLDQTLDELNTTSKKLYNINGKIGAETMKNDLFQSISQRNSIPGGSCSFDLPAFHYWLSKNSDAQNSDLTQWTEPLAGIRTAIGLILNFIRQSNTPTKEHAIAGFFQLSLDQLRPFQMLVVSIDPSFPCFAEISGGKHRFSIRLMSPSPSSSERSSQTTEDIPFLLTRCVF